MNDKPAGIGSQTLLRGLDILEAVAVRQKTLAMLTAELGLTKSTVQRLAASLVERGYLALVPRRGYRLGPQVLALGFRMQNQLDLVQAARPYLEGLAQSSGDTVHLGVLANDQALYLDKISGSRRIEISSRVGELQPLTTTGIGKALLLDESPARWEALFKSEQPQGIKADWLGRMKLYAASGYAFDLEENEDRIRCVSAPIRDGRGAIIGSISVSGAAHYMDDERMAVLADEVRAVVGNISKTLGWLPG